MNSVRGEESSVQVEFDAVSGAGGKEHIAAAAKGGAAEEVGGRGSYMNQTPCSTCDSSDRFNLDIELLRRHELNAIPILHRHDFVPTSLELRLPALPGDGALNQTVGISLRCVNLRILPRVLDLLMPAQICACQPTPPLRKSQTHQSQSNACSAASTRWSACSPRS